MYLIGKNLTGKNFRQQKNFSAKNFVTLKIFVTFYRAASFILLFREYNFGKHFRRQICPSAIIFVTRPKFRHFLPVKFLPIRYLYEVPTVSTRFAYKRLATPDWDWKWSCLYKYNFFKTYFHNHQLNWNEPHCCLTLNLFCVKFPKTWNSAF